MSFNVNTYQKAEVASILFLINIFIYGRRTFAYNAPRLWNALPLHIRTEESLDSFKKAVKTLLFQDTYGFKAKAYMYH